jgi:leukotriene-A4 hydrolase
VIGHLAEGRFRAAAAWVAVLVVLLSGAATGAHSAEDPASDWHSFARPAEARVTHVAIDLRVDFGTRTLGGTATLSLAVAPGAREVVLDTKDLAIERATNAAGGILAHTLGDEDAVRGRPLRVALRPGVTRVIVHYRTTPASAALQWLAPEQTAGKAHPYLFSQGQAILTRTWIPTQDSPGIRQTYRARVVVPRELKAVMSAEHLTPDGIEVPGGRAFEFALDQPVPPYLIALAVGDIAFRPLGPSAAKLVRPRPPVAVAARVRLGGSARTGIFAEPSVLDAAAYEFADLERMLEAAEALYGPYRWGRYDILVMPPSFPFGGMENPRLTFVSPTVLAGDRSLVSLAAHELAHSWSGNLVTNATWRDFWLNEGFTTYFENRIMEELYGPERAKMLQVIERQELEENLAQRAGTPGETVLYADVKGADPDASISSVPYGKGAAFLRMLERHFGRGRFDAWLRSFFDRHAFTSITTPAFLEDLRATLLGNDAALEKQLRIHEWLFEPGLPENDVLPRSEALESASAYARQVVAQGRVTPRGHTDAWVTQQRQRFLASLPERVTPALMADLDATFRFSERANAEVLFLWLRLAIRSTYRAAYPALDRFLSSQGRRKFVEPLFAELVKTGGGRAEAARIYEKARPMYHATTRQAVEAILARGP